MKRRFAVDVDPSSEVLALIGSKEGIAHLFTAFVDPGDYTLVPGCGYPVYHTGGIMVGGETWWMPMTEENGFLADFDSTPADVLAKAKMMFLSYPNNPTLGYRQRRVLRSRHRVRQGARPAYRARQRVLRDRLRRLRRAELPAAPGREGRRDRALQRSKAYNMTGWRVAFACGNAQAIKALGTVKSNIDSGVFTAVQDAAIEAFLGTQDSIGELNALYQRRRDLVLAALDKIGIEVPFKPVGHHLRLGEGPGGLHLGELRREGARGGQRHRGSRLVVRSERRGLHPHLAHHA